MKRGVIVWFPPSVRDAADARRLLVLSGVELLPCIETEFSTEFDTDNVLLKLRTRSPDLMWLPEIPECGVYPRYELDQFARMVADERIKEGRP